MHDHYKFSVCIPTFARPVLLTEALLSCLSQDHKPSEILIGVDFDSGGSEDDLLENVDTGAVEIIIVRSRVRLGQAANVNRLFDLARYPWLVLLHDDDRLLPSGLSKLVEAADSCRMAEVLYGKQQIIDIHGQISPTFTDDWNTKYRRSADFIGSQPSAMAAALYQQFPNDGYMIKTQLARQVRYRSEEEVGHGVDAEFGIRVAAAVNPEQFVYVDDYISQYRRTPESLSQSKVINRREDLLFSLVENFPVAEQDAEARDVLLSRIAPSAVLDGARAGRKVFPLRVMFSRYYLDNFWNRWTLYRLLCVISPFVADRVRMLILARRSGFLFQWSSKDR